MKHLLAAVFAILAMPDLAGAAEPRRPDTSQRELKEVRGIQTRFGDCVVKKRYAAARNFVLTPTFEEPSDWRRAVDKIADGDCLIEATAAAGGVEMKFPSDLMRYALADALVRREFSSSVPPSIEDAAPLIQPVFNEADYVPKPGRKVKQKELDKLAENRGKQVALVYLAEYGECVVRAALNPSHALIMAEPGSGQENTAFASLKPALSECLVAGQSLTFGKTALRGTIAMNFYRLAHAPKAAPPAAGASR